MRLLVLTDQIPPKFLGGMARHAEMFVRYFSNCHTVVLMIPYHSRMTRIAGVKILPCLTGYQSIDSIVALIVSAFFRPDIIHTCSAGLSYLSLSRHYIIVQRVVGNDFIRPWVGKVPLLMKIRYRFVGNEQKSSLRKKEMFQRQLSIRSQLERVNKIVANTEFTKELLFNKLTVPSVVIKGGYDSNLFKYKIRSRNSKIVFVTVANLVQDKGHDVSIKIIAGLLKLRELEYHIVGSGPEIDNLLRLSNELLLDEHITFHGELSQQQIALLFDHCDVYLQTSNFESMGRSIMEAGASGLPIFSTKVGGIPTFIKNGETGFLMDYPVDVEPWVHKINSLLNDTNLINKVAHKFAIEARDRYSWDSVFREYSNLFENLLGSKL